MGVPKTIPPPALAPGGIACADEFEARIERTTRKALAGGAAVAAPVKATSAVRGKTSAAAAAPRPTMKLTPWKTDADGGLAGGHRGPTRPKSCFLQEFNDKNRSLRGLASVALHNTSSCGASQAELRDMSDENGHPGAIHQVEGHSTGHFGDEGGPDDGSRSAGSVKLAQRHVCPFPGDGVAP